MKKFLRRWLALRVAVSEANPYEMFLLDAQLQVALQTQLDELQRSVRERLPGNPASEGFKAYSQADEDGIIEAIMERLGIAAGRFVEIGTGDGRENNTHYLLLKGWSGAWIDADAEAIERARLALGDTTGRLSLRHARVDRDNVAAIARTALGVSAENRELDFLSVDIDGNDLDVTLPLVEELRPKVVCVEYNAKIRPPLKVSIAYDSSHIWRGDDYQGASLSAWTDAMTPHCTLVACSLAGTNAFFVRNDLAGAFPRYPEKDLFQPARYQFSALRSGHPPSTGFLRLELLAKTRPSNR
jgi:hypothetical protein